MALFNRRRYHLDELTLPQTHALSCLLRPLFSLEICILSQMVPLWVVNYGRLSSFMLLVLYGLVFVLLPHPFCTHPPFLHSPTLGWSRTCLSVSKELTPLAHYRTTLPFMAVVHSKEREKGEGMIEGCSVWQNGRGSPWEREKEDTGINCRKKEECEKNRIQWKSLTFCKHTDSLFQKQFSKINLKREIRSANVLC